MNLRQINVLALLVVPLGALSLACGARSELRVLRTDGSVSSDISPVDVPNVDIRLIDVAEEDVPSVDIVERDERPFDCRPNPRQLCDDRSGCTVDSCNNDGTCAHRAIECNDNDPCTTDVCIAATGCVFMPRECGGCADGVREAFRDRERYPDIAGCGGGFSLMGLARETSPACARGAGNNGPNPNGVGCAATDLCAAGFHVCRSSAEVRARSVDGCDGARDGGDAAFWASRQTGSGCLQCATGVAPGCSSRDCRADCAPNNETTNDIFGCGTIGSVPQQSCAPLNRSGNNLCGALVPPWTCTSNDPGADVRESEFVRKLGPGAGGVLCCRD